MKSSSLLPLFLAVSLVGCAAGPSLRALNPAEAKIDVYPTGEVRVFGEPVPIAELKDIVRSSDTEPSDTVLIRLHGDPESPEFTELRRYLTDQMIRGGHYKFRFFSTPQASVATIDPSTGKTETYVSGLPVTILSGEAMHAEINRMEAEQKAYEDGSYVSDAVGRQPVAVGERPVDLKIAPQAVQEAASQPASVPKKGANASQESLQERWRRQQQHRRVAP